MLTSSRGATSARRESARDGPADRARCQAARDSLGHRCTATRGPLPRSHASVTCPHTARCLTTTSLETTALRATTCHHCDTITVTATVTVIVTERPTPFAKTSTKPNHTQPAMDRACDGSSDRRCSVQMLQLLAGSRCSRRTSELVAASQPYPVTETVVAIIES